MTGVVLFYVFVLLAWDLAQQLPGMCLVLLVGMGVSTCMLYQFPTSIRPIKLMGGQAVYCVGLQAMP